MISLPCWRNSVALIVISLLISIAHAGEPIATVRIPFVRDPVDKSYRKMISGMDLFARGRHFAPAATLRFRLLPRLPNSRLDGVTLRIAGDTVSQPVELGSDLSFTLPRDAQAWREDAAVLANRRSDSMTWRAWVASAGVAPGTRRLGDLRLECRVGVQAGLISNSSPLFGWLNALLTDADAVCSAPDGNYLFFSDRPLFGVTLRDGARTATLPLSMLYAGGTQDRASLPYCDCQVLLERSYYAPLWDRSWPDDTVLEFDYMDAP